MGRRRPRRGERGGRQTYRLRFASALAMKVGKSTESARASRSRLTIPTLRHPPISQLPLAGPAIAMPAG